MLEDVVHAVGGSEEGLLSVSGAADDASPAANSYEPLANLVTRQVREAILDGRLKPGGRVGQEQLARQFGVSRIPVREALRRLESEGLITLVPHSGARVARLDMSECNELYRIRELVEPTVLEESARRLTGDQLASLRKLVGDMEQAAGEPARWLDLDRRFHLQSFAAAPMPRMLSMVERFWNQTQHYRRAYLASDHGANRQVANFEHRLIFDAISLRDPSGAAMRLCSHIRRTRITLTKAPDLFEGA